MRQILRYGAYCAALIFAGSAAAQEANSGANAIQYYGDYFVQADYYGNSGDPAMAFHPETGTHYGTGVQGGMLYTISPYQTLKLEGTFYVDHNDYRNGDERGGILERGLLEWTNGDAALPFRLALGDVSVFMSRLSMQRGLKGGELELQPVSSFLGALHSLQFFGGESNLPIYRGDYGESMFYGGSYLMDFGGNGAVMAGVVRHANTSDLAVGTAIQDTYTLSATRTLNAAAQAITIDGEIAMLDGQHDVSRTDDQRGTGVLLDINSIFSDLPLSYGMRFERADEEFSPDGANAITDAQTMDSYALWRMDSGALLRGYHNYSLDALHSADTLTSNQYGLNLSNIALGEMLKDTRLSLDGFIQRNRNESRATNMRLQQFSVNTITTLNENLLATLGAIASHTDDMSAAGAGQSRKGMQAGLQWQTSWEGYAFSVGPQFSVAYVDAAADQLQTGAGLALGIHKDAHHAYVSYNMNLLDAHARDSVDSSDHNIAATYEYTQGPHRISSRMRYDMRDNSPGNEARGIMLGLEYSIALHEYFKPDVTASDGAGFATGASTANQDITAQLMRYLGRPMLDARNFADANTNTSPIVLGDSYSYSGIFLPKIFNTQTLVLESKAGSLTRYMVSISVGERDAERTLRLVNDIVNQRYGAPDSIREMGDWGTSLISRVISGSFQRQFIWNANGASIVTGIPARADGRLQVVLMVTGEPVSQGNFWAIP